MGLLSRASFISDEKKLAFSEIILKYNISTFAIFEYEENHFLIKNSIGFDGSSLLSSLSTKDFWDGICPELNKVYDFENMGASSNPTMQFFSFSLRDDIKSVSVFRNNDTIYMLCNIKLTDSIIEDLKNLDLNINNINLDKINKRVFKDTKLIKYKINFKEAVESFVTLKSIIVNNSVEFKESLYNELINRFSCFFTPYATKRLNIDTIIVLLNVDKSIQEEHIVCHLVFSLKNILNKTAEMISFENLGCADSIVEIKNYFQVE